jgi:hypothetical protein
MSLIIAIMEIIETFTFMISQEKATYCQHVVKKCMSHSYLLPDDSTEMLRIATNNPETLDNIIKNIVDLSKNKFKINPKKKSFFACFGHA